MLGTIAQNKQEKQLTYNLTLRLFHETIVGEEKQCVTYLCVCVCVCMCVRARVVVVARGRAYACALATLLIQHATRRHIVICGLSGSSKFFDIGS